ncbi:ATP phosphoribosyltransferase [Piscibacillus halophilus]|uniref:ATP phosphoribosyltransferase n=1 Tax=Piscibacillus halophilus TaxID=571933 RepID=A0A1H9K967_9BACI|nr:ATP phosphoribosyltransferase [Piscibacillus halophilus]SEQ95700.1 ATP phosphoribosyltransferase catalytic subunit [Piscibacillus halophilus]
MEKVKIALTKGRLAEESIKVFEAIGLKFSAYKEDSRKLILPSDCGRYEIILVKALDVATYVENGAADIGIAGKDTLLEANANVFELVDLGFGKCHFAVAGQGGFDLNRAIKLSVATKYPRVATQFFQEKGKQIETIKLNGSVELAPLVGLSDVIVDIVETGRTLKENGLEVIESMYSISARLVVNKAGYKTKSETLQPFVGQVKEAVSVTKG